MKRSTSLARATGALFCGWALLASGPGHAWDPATTQAGLTEQALLRSSFHRVLSRRLARPLGALEPLQLHSRLLTAEERRSLWNRINALDPAGGYRPGNDGVTTALSWATAGAVLAETPPERGRNHFFDPGRGKGLDDGAGLSGTWHALRLSVDAGGTVRGLATGTAFDLTGKASLRWVLAPENELGAAAFNEQLARAVSGADPAERETALVRALMALGGTLAALEDAGEPAHVRDDFRSAYLQRQSASGWDRGSNFERYVAREFAREGVPAPGEPVRRPSLAEYFTSADGKGLADRTQRRFFSEGTVPEPVAVDPSTTPKQVAELARASLTYPAPTITRLELRKPGKRYLTVDGRRALAYVREPDGVRFFLDETIYAEAARALLPEVGAYAAGLADHLLRAGLTLTVDGGTAKVALEGAVDGIEGTLQVFVEDAGGVRRPLEAAAGARRFGNGEIASLQLPAGTRRVAAVVRGNDGAGAVVAVGEAAVP